MVRLIEESFRVETPAMPGHSSLLRMRGLHYGALSGFLPLGGGRPRHRYSTQCRDRTQPDVLRQYMHDHVVHFYHLHAMDWVDVVNALLRRPEGDLRARSEHFQLVEEFAGLLLRPREKREGFVKAQLGIFANGC